METLSTLKFAARAKRIRCSVLQKEAGVGYTAEAMETMFREVTFLRKRLSGLNFCGQSMASLSTGDRTLSGSDFSPNCVTRGMEEAVENKEDVQVCMDAAKRELVEAIGKLTEVEGRLQLAAQAAKDTAIHGAGGASGSAQPSSPSLTRSATCCDHSDSVSRHVLHRSGHAVSMCQPTPVFVPQSPILVSGCRSPMLASRQVLVNAHTPCVASTWRVSPRAHMQPRHRSLSPGWFGFREAPIPNASMHGRPHPPAFSPHAAPSTQWSWGAVGTTQRWAHI